MSEGAKKLLAIVQEIFPNQHIILEHHIDGLFLDIFLPKLSMAFEYDGQQHLKYNSFFHKNREEFLASKKRDLLKEELCSHSKITLIRINCNESLNKETILEKIISKIDE